MDAAKEVRLWRKSAAILYMAWWAAVWIFLRVHNVPPEKQVSHTPLEDLFFMPSAMICTVLILDSFLRVYNWAWTVPSTTPVPKVGA